MPPRSRSIPWLKRLVTLAVLAVASVTVACLGDTPVGRGGAGEAAIDLRGLRPRSQVSGDVADAVQSARFVIYLVTGTTRRVVATRVFTAQDLDVADTDDGTVFTLTFPYTSADDKFEVQGFGMSAQGDTLYAVGPVGFTMRDATSQGGQATVSTTVAPVYVGPGRTATKLVISPRSVVVSEGKTASVTPTLLDASGTPLSSSTFRFHWWTNDNSIARFDDQRVGVVTGGQRPGTTWLHVEFDEMPLRDSVLVTNAVSPAQLIIMGGAGQTGAAGSTLPQPISVKVASAGGSPVSGMTVTFAVTSGGGSVSASTRVTGADGTVSVNWTLGPTAGAQQLTASTAGVAALVISATATVVIPSAARSTISVLPTAILVGGDAAVVTAVLRDANGSPMPGVSATFSGPSSLSFSPPSGVTDATGTITTRVSATAAGTATIGVVVAGQTIVSTTVQVGVRVGTPASISIVSGDNQTVKLGTNFPAPLVVVVKDAAGNPVSGALVDWAADIGDGRTVTDANGQSSASYFLNVTWPLGPSTVSVTLTGYGLKATFKFTAVP